VRLPQSLPAALDALAGDEDLKEAMGPLLHDVYLKHKRFENDLFSELSPEEQCERYRLVY
jgi:glutamine synthetase